MLQKHQLYVDTFPACSESDAIHSRPPIGLRSIAVIIFVLFLDSGVERSESESQVPRGPLVRARRQNPSSAKFHRSWTQRKCQHPKKHFHLEFCATVGASTHPRLVCLVFPVGRATGPNPQTRFEILQCNHLHPRQTAARRPE